MGIATPPPLPSILSYSSKLDSSNSMSQDYQQGIFSFSNGFERSAVTPQQQQLQIRREKVRLQQGFEGAPPLVGIEEEEGGELPVYETAGMLSEMFNFPPAGATAAELLEQQSSMTATYRSPRPQAVASSSSEWYGNRQGMITTTGLGPLGDSKNQNSVNSRDSNMVQHHHHHHHQISSINADSAAAMQLFLMNPPQTRSPSPSPPTSSTLHMLLPHPSSNSLQGFTGSGPPSGTFGQFTWVHDGAHPEGGTTGPHLNNNSQGEIGGVVESQGLSLSLSSSLQHLEAAKAEELRMGDSGFIYYNQGGGIGGGAGQSSSAQFPYKNNNNLQALHLQGGSIGHNNNNQGFGSSLGVVNVLRNSKYVKAAQELLEEFCSVGRGQFKKSKFNRQNSNPNSNPGGGGGGSSSSSKDPPPPPPPLSAADRIEHQRRKVKLLSMLDEACNLYFCSLFLSLTLSHPPRVKVPHYLFLLICLLH